MPSAPEADEALKISLLLSSPRQPAVIADSRLREARERAQRLAERLQAHPAAWRDVLDLLCLMEPEETAVTLARLLGAGVDTRSEPELLERMNSGSRQGRCVALQLLSTRRSHEALSALVAAAEDREPRVRLAALLALGDRPGEPGDVAYEALARRGRMDPDPILQDTARRLLGERVPSRQPAPVVRHGTFSGGLTLPSSTAR